MPSSGRLYLGLQDNVFESNKGVTDWRTITVGSNIPNGGTQLAKPHPDQHAFAFYPGINNAANSAVYEGNDGGIWRYSPLPLDPVDQSATANTPVAEVLGDFDGDGKPDIAILNSGNSSLVIRKGNGDGTFGTPTQVLGAPDLSQVTALVAADFNQDGQLDLALGQFDGTVRVFLNNGSANGTWRFTSRTYDTGLGLGGVTALAVGHFNDNSPSTGAKDVDLVAVGGIPDAAA